MFPRTLRSRREIMAALGTGFLVSRQQNKAGKVPTQTQKPEENVGPAEDLMREHGVLKRVLLIYRDAIRRMDEKQAVPADVVAGAAGIIRSFIEDYHEKLEEDHLFPRFRKTGRLVDLVDVLFAQHKAGRILTGNILQLARPEALKNAGERQKLRSDLNLFVRMYEPHEAREDTVLFPAFHEMLSEKEYDELGDEFERKEDQLFGDKGFEKNVEAVAALEKKLGIYDLSQFTPRV